MVKEYISLKMGIQFKDNFKMALSLKASFNIQMEINIRGKYQMEKKMVQESWYIITEQFTMVNGKMM